MRPSVVLEIIGIAGIMAGVWLVFPPGALIVGGVAAVLLAQGVGK